jgi:formylglycine-generating enzyme required for sulfatase activity
MDSIEVTQSAFRNVMSTIPTELFNGDQLPVQNATWFDAIMYCNALSKLANLDTVYSYGPITSIGAYNLGIDWGKNGYRLPTEDEWELAAKGGKELTFATDDGSIPCSKAKYLGCGANTTVNVGFYPANPFGLHDLSGNISEWCWNRYLASDSGRINGRSDYVGQDGTVATYQRIVRGGSYADYTTALMTTSRSFAPAAGRYPANVLENIGFRCVRLAP